ncbi:MAG: hypothetical protein BWZ02_02759 [Lentisphaerae bacterium ADurb.BinA184]|nr:MAG: hypothetical protein BWZ02_02759 [Lentisphaerae bacterium ADurb.BinA184]
MSSPVAAQALPVNAISHGWIRPVRHPDLGVEVNGQSVVRYLRFGREVRIARLELKPLVAGRWVPAVPTHPAHVTVSRLDAAGRWQVLRDVELPPDPRIGGEGLHQGMSVQQMEERLRQGLAVTHTIDLGGMTTDLLRVECDREHPVWPNHGECNGTPFNVPFGALDTLAAFGEAPPGDTPLPEYLPPLKAGTVAATAPAGMTVEAQPWLVLFRGPTFSVGFSLIRPEILHLGWDGTGSGRAGENRVYRARSAGLYTGLSGPLVRTARADFGANLWTGRVEVQGNQVRYRALTCGLGVTLDATFTVTPEGLHLALTQEAARAVPVIEAEAWRLLWNCAAAMTAAAALPTLRPGRNGEVELPMLWAGDGNGCLRCEKLGGEAWLQMESYRQQNAVAGGLVPGARPLPTHSQSVPAGTLTSEWQLSVTAFEPQGAARHAPRLPAALRQHWGSVYSCFRPELGGFSNNAVSVNCHVNQHCPMETVAFTQTPERGPDPLTLYRFTLERALLGGGGYGFWRNLYLDADPILVAGAGRCHQAEPDIAWLRRIEPGLAQAATRILDTLGPDGLVVCCDLSGNSGSYRWSSNAMDVVGFGHVDAYVNAWSYRALRNAAPLLAALGQAALAARCTAAAENLRQAYPRHLLNPATGWVAGWRSRDGQLHDAAYLWVNGVACAYGLLPAEAAAEALRRLERLRREAGAGHAHFGLPFNLRPIPPGDHMLPQLFGRFTPTFENYTDGAMAACFAMYYLRALDRYGLHEEAAAIVADLEAGYERGHFNGGVGSGVEFYRWDGVPTGYEGSFVANWVPLYAIAIHRGLFTPTDPEWWPA